MKIERPIFLKTTDVSKDVMRQLPLRKGNEEVNEPYEVVGLIWSR